MQSIKDFTDEELIIQIANALDDLDTAEYETADYNAALSELHVATNEVKRRQ